MVKFSLGLLLLGIGLFIFISQKDKISQVITPELSLSSFQVISTPQVISQPLEKILKLINPKFMFEG